MKRIIGFLVSGALVLASITYNSCSFLDAAEPIPAYIYIDTVVLQTENNEGSSEHGIKDVWVSVGSKLVGVFPLPAMIPVLEEGEQEISVFAGVIQNGIAAARDIYPFYRRYSVTTNLVPTEIDTIHPVIGYLDNTNFAILEDFEASNILSDDLDGNTFTKVVTTETDVFEGNRSGLITLSGSNNLIEVGSNLYYDLGETVQNVYLEMHYKNDVNFELGIAGKGLFYFERFYKVGMIPSTEWRKIYIDLTNEVKTMKVNSANEFQISYRALSVDTTQTAEIKIDNIKLIYR